jgi:hypothetical protein
MAATQPASERNRIVLAGVCAIGYDPEPVQTALAAGALLVRDR